MSNLEKLEYSGIKYFTAKGEMMLQMWGGEPWIFWKHPDGDWVSQYKAPDALVHSIESATGRKFGSKLERAV